MRKQVFGKRLKRDVDERKALFKSLMSHLVLKERIKTTEAKAKAIKGRIEKLVTEAKKTLRQAQGKGEQAANLFGLYLSPAAVEKLISDVAPRFSERSGGYTRILRLGPRLSDNAQMVLIEWVEGPATTETQNRDETLKEQKIATTEGTVKDTERTEQKSVKTVVARQRKTVVARKISRKSKTKN